MTENKRSLTYLKLGLKRCSAKNKQLDILLEVSDDGFFALLP